MPALPRISWCADKGFLYFDIERKKYTIPVLHCYREFTQNLGQPLGSFFSLHMNHPPPSHFLLILHFQHFACVDVQLDNHDCLPSFRAIISYGRRFYLWDTPVPIVNDLFALQTKMDELLTHKFKRNFLSFPIHQFMIG